MHDQMNDAEPDDGGTGFDPGATARQIGLFESANGVPHGIVAMVLAFLLAAVAYPIYRLRRRG